MASTYGSNKQRIAQRGGQPTEFKAGYRYHAKAHTSSFVLEYLGEKNGLHQFRAFYAKKVIYTYTSKQLRQKRTGYPSLPWIQWEVREHVSGGTA